MLIESLLVLILILLVILIILIIKYSKPEIESKDIESAISKTWMDSHLGERIGAIETYAKDIRDSCSDFEQMLRVPTERASFGELSLETIFSDQLPDQLFGIREKTLDGKVPDAHIKSTEGIICIDSKFPLVNYKKMIDSEITSDIEGYKKLFLRNVKNTYQQAVPYVEYTYHCAQGT